MRRKLELTQEALANKAGIHRVTLTRIEAGAKPTQETKVLVEAVVGPIDWIETAKTVRTRTPNYHSAEKLIERLVATTAAMDGEEREAVNQLVMKYFIS
jgi:DNA-binding XRE family transcriptional regulator